MQPMADEAIPAERAGAAEAQAGRLAGATPGDPGRAVARPPPERFLSKREATTFLAAVALFLFLSVFAKGFVRFDNLLDISRLFSLWCIVAVGETLLLIAKEVDLSVGSHYAFLVTILGFLA